MIRGGGRRLLMLALCGSLAVLFAALGIWQVERLSWKRDLIARVEARVTAAPAPVPARSTWPSLDPKAVEYRRVGATGNANPDGPHLHFAINRMQAGEKWHQGAPINPYPLLAGNRGSR